MFLVGFFLVENKGRFVNVGSDVEYVILFFRIRCYGVFFFDIVGFICVLVGKVFFKCWVVNLVKLVVSFLMKVKLDIFF